MKKLLEIINQNSFFYISSLLLIVACSLFLSIYTKAEGFMIMNSFHTSILTIFFQKFTFCGDGIFTLILFIIILPFKKHRQLAILLLISFLISGIFSQIIKQIITSARPVEYFQSHHYSYYLDTFSNSGIGFSSFPSGHTASAFAMVTVISNYFRKKYICALSLLFAMTVGYSRIYLANHFLIDVLGGAVIGIVSATLTLFWFHKIYKDSKKSLLTTDSIEHSDNQ